MAATQRYHKDYTIGWICALPVEMAASKAMLQTIHPRLPQSPNDHNIYTLGELYGHNIVIACLPLGIFGICSAALVATHMLHTFPELRFTLLVGISGGVPSGDQDIRLGDVVISKPTDTFGGVVQYDHGKAITGNRFQRTGALNKPPSILLSAISHLQADSMIGNTHIPLHLAKIMARFNRRARPCYPGPEYDVLFEPEYQHTGDPDEAVTRPPRSSNNPRMHYGLIASGNQVIKDGIMRDRVVDALGGDVLCFEMEAAVLMDDFKCLVIRGICDYADSHKSKLWQPYAAGVAAAYAKELLSIIPVTQTQTSPKAYIDMPSKSLSKLSLEDILKLPRIEPTPLQNNIMQIGESGLIRRAQFLALAGPWYASSMCTTCELLELEFDSKDIAQMGVWVDAEEALKLRFMIFSSHTKPHIDIRFTVKWKDGNISYGPVNPRCDGDWNQISNLIADHELLSNGNLLIVNDKERLKQRRWDFPNLTDPDKKLKQSVDHNKQEYNVN
ncbi:unnamed protein product [Penicillium glandicola]